MVAAPLFNDICPGAVRASWLFCKTAGWGDWLEELLALSVDCSGVFDSETSTSHTRGSSPAVLVLEIDGLPMWVVMGADVLPEGFGKAALCSLSPAVF